VLHHLLANCLPPLLLMQSRVLVATAILWAVCLGFPRAGGAAAHARVGHDTREGPRLLHISIFPGLTILLTVLDLYLLGDRLRGVLDPQAAA